MLQLYVNPSLKIIWQGDFPDSPVVETLPLHTGSKGSIPSQRAKIPHASQSENQNIKQKEYCNKFNEDLKKWSTSKKVLRNVFDGNKINLFILKIQVHFWMNQIICQYSSNSIILFGP